MSGYRRRHNLGCRHDRIFACQIHLGFGGVEKATVTKQLLSHATQKHGKRTVDQFKKHRAETATMKVLSRDTEASRG